MYDVIVLGATFAAAGIAHTYKKKCLILEEGLQGGKEFYGALNFGSSYDLAPKAKEALAMQKEFLSIDEYNRITRIYPYLQQADVLFSIRLVSVQRSKKGFTCIAHGIEGFSTFEAKHVIDTRASDKISASKTYNCLIESKETPNFLGIDCKKADMEEHYVLRFPTPLSHGYAEARAEVEKVILQFSETQKLILFASEFDYEIKKDLPEETEGIHLLPSKAFPNPMLAFEAGLEVNL